jgi:hypothetical protein
VEHHANQCSHGSPHSLEGCSRTPFSVSEGETLGELLDEADRVLPAHIRAEAEKFTSTYHSPVGMLRISTGPDGFNCNFELTGVDAASGEVAKLTPSAFFLQKEIWNLWSQLGWELTALVYRYQQNFVFGMAHHLHLTMTIAITVQHITPRYVLSARDNATGETIATKVQTGSTLGLCSQLAQAMHVQRERRSSPRPTTVGAQLTSNR